MLRIALHDAKPGMSLAMPAENPRQRDHVLLKAGYKLDAASISRLDDFYVRYIWVKYPSFEFLQDFVDPKIKAAQQDVVDNISQAFQSAEKGASAHISYAAYTKTIGALMASLVENPQAAVFMHTLLDESGGELMRHSAAATYLSLLMGLKLEGYLVRQRKHLDPGRAKQVIDLGVGAMLHDVGVTLLDEEVRGDDPVTGCDWDPAWREHTSLGYELVRGQIPPPAANIVLHHHQRCDGSGYVGGEHRLLDGHRFHVFGRIVGLADEYDRLCHRPGPDGPETLPAVFALAELLRPSMLNKFDPQVVRALLAVVPPYAPGTIVRLNDERWAVCIEHCIDEPCRPKVQIIDDPTRLNPDRDQATSALDLTEHSPLRLWIAQCDGHDVSNLNFVRPNLDREGFVEVALV